VLGGFIETKGHSSKGKEKLWSLEQHYLKKTGNGFCVSLLTWKDHKPSNAILVTKQKKAQVK
jgi:hypothetical protein